MKTLIFDIETDGLNATKIWCITILNLETKKILSYYKDSINQGLEILKNAKELIGHNIIGFDIPVIKKLYNIDLFNKIIIDTLVISRLFNPVREGGHSLKVWGDRLNLPKIDFEEFDQFSMEMVQYCERDTLLNEKVYNYLKTEAKDFSKESIQLEHKTAKILNEQKQRGFLFDNQAALSLNNELNNQLTHVVNEVHKEFKPKKDYITLHPIFNKNGVLSKMAMNTQTGKKIRITPEEFKTIKYNSYVIKCKITEFNLGSRKQIGEYLQEFGWKPEKFTPTGQPIVDEGTLKKIENIPQALLIAEFLMLQKRIALINSWCDAQQKDGRVHGFVDSNGTITGRMTHRSPNIAQVPSPSSKYGSKCRSCWIVPKNYKLLGIDASGLELRMLAHYMNDKKYINEILTGDIHITNQKLAGLSSRSQAKTFIYALIYGAGDRMLGTIIKGNRNDGKELRKRFLTNLPTFKNLKDKVITSSLKGFIKGLDGRKLLIRSQHAALNTLLQGGGAIAMKWALIDLNNKIKSNLNIKGGFVANIHDEWQIETPEEYADIIGNWGVNSIKEAGNHYKLNCPLDGEYKIGNNWNETH